MFDLSCLARIAENTKSMWLILAQILHFLIRRRKHRFTACCCFHDSKLTKLWKATVFLDAKQCIARNAHTQRCNTRVPRGPIKKNAFPDVLVLLLTLSQTLFQSNDRNLVTKLWSNSLPRKERRSQQYLNIRLYTGGDILVNFLFARRSVFLVNL